MIWQNLIEGFRDETSFGFIWDLTYSRISYDSEIVIIHLVLEEE